MTRGLVIGLAVMAAGGVLYAVSELILRRDRRRKAEQAGPPKPHRCTDTERVEAGIAYLTGMMGTGHTMAEIGPVLDILDPAHEHREVRSASADPLTGCEPVTAPEPPELPEQPGAPGA